MSLWISRNGYYENGKLVFLHWGHDISPEENQYEAGLSFAISYKKANNFIGKENLLKVKGKKQDRRFYYAVSYRQQTRFPPVTS